MTQQTSRPTNIEKTGQFFQKKQLESFRGGMASMEDLLRFQKTFKEGGEAFEPQIKKQVLKAKTSKGIREQEAGLIEAKSEEGKKIKREFAELLPLLAARTKEVILSRSRPGVRRQTREF